MTTVLTLMKVELFDWKPELLCFPLSLGCKTLNNILFSLQSANMKNLIIPVYTTVITISLQVCVCMHCFTWEAIHTNQIWKRHSFLKVNVSGRTEIVLISHCNQGSEEMIRFTSEGRFPQ